MKLAAFFLLGAALHVSAKGLSQEKITLSLKNAPLEKVFNAIETQSGFVFIYKNETVKDKKVSIQVSNVSLAEALDACLKGQALSYQIVGKSVAIKTAHTVTDLVENETANAPPLIDVKGKVLNEKGDPVEGVTVRVKGSEKFTLTDKNGEFSLVTVERDAVLLFTHITMESFELKVSGQTELLIKLRTKVSSLGEVVVSVNTGYQQVSKERFVGSYSQLDSAAYNRRAGLGIIDRLDGAVTGVLIDKKKGLNALSSMQIRGLSTLGSNYQPLIIVDNFEYTLDLNNINPNDVENITVLKDAAATSIWGARAGNGVVVITTKKGKFNQPLRVSVRSNVTIAEKPNLYYYPQMSVADYVDMEQSLFNKGYYDVLLANTTSRPAVSPVVELLAQRQAGKISPADSAEQMNAFKQLDLRRDLGKYAYRNAVSQQHYLNLTTGSDLIAYNFSAGYNRTLNNVQHSKADDQITLNSSVKVKVIKNLEISNDIRYTYGRNNSTTFALPYLAYPYMQLADAEGHYLAVPYGKRVSYLDTVGGGQLLDWQYRPLAEPGLADFSITSKTVQLNLNISYKIASWLNATASYQYTNEADDIWDYSSLKTFSARDRINQFTNLSQTTPALRNPLPIGGILNTTNAKSSNQNFRGGLNLDKSFWGLHRVSAILMADISEAHTAPSNTNTFYNYDKDKGTYQQYVDYTSYFPQYLGNVTSRIPNGSGLYSEKLRRFVSFSGNLSYNYNGLYTIYGSARRDGSNIFGVNANNKWKPLWSVGTSWNISKEKFYSVSWMSSLRLRASYGYAGNPGPSDVTGFPVIVYTSTFAPYTNLPVGGIRSAPNPDLRWEKVQTINGGIDFSLFKSRISGSVDVWQKRSTDLITNIPVAPAAGVTLFSTNSANLKGNGFELNIVTKNITGGTFEWQSNWGLSRAKTIVTKYLANSPLYKAEDFILYGLNATEGRIVYGLSSFRWAGLDPANGDPRGYLGKQVSSDYNTIFNDSVQNQVFHGSALPLYSGFLSNTFHWKNFTFSANITYRLNFYFRKPTINYEQLVNTGYGHTDYTLRWQNPGDEKVTNIPSFPYPINSNRDKFFQYSEINVLRGDNIRLQDARLQYDWNNKRSKGRTVKGFQLFVYANNLNIILWRKNKSKLDPDFIGASNVLITPTSKTYAGGISLNF